MSAPQESPDKTPDQRVADAVSGNWVDRYAPRPARRYLRLMRADRPIGSWLLMWPGWWAIAMAAPYSGFYVPDLWLLFLFGVGAIVMRGAGCVWNDITDRDIDGQVARTASRPIPSGQVSVMGALAFLAFLCLIGLAILVQLNGAAIGLGVLSLVLIVIYPFAKRFTYWPQIFLGLAMNWGALLGWAADAGTLHLGAFLLYGAGIAWTLGYDTIYAHQDKEDDALIGVKSTALKFGDNTKPWLWGFYGATLALLAAAGAVTEIGWVYYIGLGFGGWHLARQIYATDLDRPEQCLAAFRSNRDLGAIVFASIVAGTLGSGIY